MPFHRYVKRERLPRAVPLGRCVGVGGKSPECAAQQHIRSGSHPRRAPTPPGEVGHDG
jgi:ribosome modulation factor